jgi:hypothetical protein
MRRAGDGSLPELDREKIRTRAQQAHAQRRRLRLWAAPDTPEAWEILDACGVDLINTDRLKELAPYLEKIHPSQLSAGRRVKRSN